MSATAEPRPQRLTGVTSTMLLTLSYRMLDAACPNPIVGDAWAGDLLRRMGERPRQRHNPLDRYPPLLRSRRLDAWTSAYLAEHPDTLVLHLGAGLDSRAFRLPIPDETAWYDVDLPDVMALRRQLYPERSGRHTIATSVTEPGWIPRTVPGGRRTLVIAEGLFPYLDEQQIIELVSSAIAHGSQGEIWFDSLPRKFVHNPAGQLFRVNRLFRWGLSGPDELERWHPRLRLIEQASVIAENSVVGHSGARVALRALGRLRVFRELLQLNRLRWEAP